MLIPGLSLTNMTTASLKEILQISKHNPNTDKPHTKTATLKYMVVFRITIQYKIVKLAFYDTANPRNRVAVEMVIYKWLKYKHSMYKWST